MTEPLTAEPVAMALGTDVAKGPVQHKTGPISKIAATLVNCIRNMKKRGKEGIIDNTA